MLKLNDLISKRALFLLSPKLKCSSSITQSFSKNYSPQVSFILMKHFSTKHDINNSHTNQESNITNSKNQTHLKHGTHHNTIDNPTNFYGIPPASHGDEHHHDDHSSHGHGPRDHLNADGTVSWGLSSEHYHWYDPLRGTPPKMTQTIDGEKFVKGVETRPMDQLYTVTQENLPFWPRTKLNFWGNHELGLKIEFLFFWIPTFIIATLAIPCLTMIYMNEETIFNTMTVKIIGRQWYWIYEVESPPEEDEE